MRYRWKKSEIRNAMSASQLASQLSGNASLSVTRVRYSRASSDNVEFCVLVSPLNSTSSSSSSASVDDGDMSLCSDSAENKDDLGGGQIIWRSYAAFKALHSALSRSSDGKRLSLRLPKRPSSLAYSTTDGAELLRCLLDDYVKKLSSIPKFSESEALKSFIEASVRPDWPLKTGAIDLAVHDCPHESSVTEWWYLNCHFQDTEGNDFSAFAAFFRVLKHTDKDTGAKSYAHAVNWAITDVSSKAYVHESLLDRDSPAIVKKQLEGERVIKDRRLKRAYMEILDKGNVPLPDRMFEKDPAVSLKTLNFHSDGASLEKDENSNYVLKCRSHDGKTSLDLVFIPKKLPVRHGLDGVVKGHDGDDMFYYLIPRCDLAGSFSMKGEAPRVIQVGEKSTGWYDHEFGGKRDNDNDVPVMEYAWNWAAIQLNNDVDISVATLVDPRSKPQVIMEKRAIVIDAQSNRTQPDDLTFEELNSWTSVRTFNSYPTKWRVQMPSAEIDLYLEAPFADQEFVTLIAKPGFWEGRVSVTGTIKGRKVEGRGFVERNGFQTLSELDGFFKAVGKETRKAVREVYPDVVKEENAIQLIATPETAHYIEGVDLEVFHKSIIAPVRYISDMGGKSWRSYGALACMDVVGGDSRKFTRWLSMPEFMHVGSLIVDDIEDKSTKRRGVPCSHIVFGDAIAINAGTAAFFQGQQLLLVPGMSDKQLNQIYNFYFAALRAGHAGQGLDISGLDSIMDDVINRGDVKLAESRIIAIHRLKTAVPAASLARMGAVVGGGTDAQVEAVGRYYESVGIAFQIMDDVLNLRGLYSTKADKTAGLELKNLGEDISAGKVTIPVVKAIGLLPKDEMRALWNIIKTKPMERKVIDGCIATLEKCGAIDACVAQAVSLVDDSFAKLDEHIPDSFSKLMLRAFGFFVIEQQG